MTRCVSCNRNLNDSESTRRVASTGEFLDMCNKCYKDISADVPTINRPDLNPNEEAPDDFDDYEYVGKLVDESGAYEWDE